MNVNFWKFSPTATEKPTMIFDEPKDFLKEQYKKGLFGNGNIQKFGVYKLMGWAYDFKPFLKIFVYKQHGQWNEMYAPNKTLLRNVVYGKIDKIIEVTK